MIQTENLTYKYPNGKTFSFPAFKVDDKETFLILGKSGVGKTTFLHLLAALLQPTHGTITINGINLNTLNREKLSEFRSKNIGIIYQKPHFVSALTVKENLMLSNYLAHKISDDELLNNLSLSLDIKDLLHKKTNELSLGEQQRVGIARALMNNPAVILADEPTSSLDDENCKNVIELLQNQSEKIGASLIIVTHDQRLKNIFGNQVTLI
jgi:lipoprotein-releasing system ATP-binding protein